MGRGNGESISSIRVREWGWMGVGKLECPRFPPKISRTSRSNPSTLHAAPVRALISAKDLPNLGRYMGSRSRFANGAGNWAILTVD